MKRFFAFLLLGLGLSLGLSGLQNGVSNQNVATVAVSSGGTVTKTTFVTSVTLGTDTIANNGYELGMEIDIGAAPITVTDIGIYVISGSTGTHTANIYADPFGTPTSIGSVSLNTTGLSSGYYYVTLGTPVVLSASTPYVISGNYVVSTDHTYNNDTVITHTAVATVPNSVYRPGSGTFGANGSTNNCYVPMSFKYQ